MFFLSALKSYRTPQAKPKDRVAQGNRRAAMRGKGVPGKHWICPPRTKMDEPASATYCLQDTEQVFETLCTSKWRIIKVCLY